MSREELQAALDELTASLSEQGASLDGLALDLDDEHDEPSIERAARIELLEELRGL